MVLKYFHDKSHSSFVCIGKIHFKKENHLLNLVPNMCFSIQLNSFLGVSVSLNKIQRTVFKRTSVESCYSQKLLNQ